MNPFGVDTSDKNIRFPLVSLKVIYDAMPRTQGCEKCKEINGDEEHWCCKSNTPSMYYAEFLYLWEHVQQWSKNKKKDLIFRAIKNYLLNSTSKGCVFYENGCSVYNHRPFACRMYSITPKESWDARWESLKKRDGDKFSARPQCEMVSSEFSVNKEMEDKWMVHTRLCEEKIGVPSNIIKSHDGPDGSYLSAHDHLLLELFHVPEGSKFLEQLTKIKNANLSSEEIDNFIMTIKEQFMVV